MVKLQKVHESSRKRCTNHCITQTRRDVGATIKLKANPKMLMHVAGGH